MNSSREELIELTEFKSPFRDRTKRVNKIDSANSITSVSTANSEESNIKNIFSVTPKKQNVRNPTSPDRQTVSEISDEVFMVGPSTSKASVSRKTYKEKISEHLRKIKERASTPSSSHGNIRGKIPIERIKKDSENLDAEIENVRVKFKLGENDQARSDFFNFNLQEQAEVLDENDLYFYSPPERMSFNIDLSEKENLFIPKSNRSVETDIKLGNSDPSQNEDSSPKISNSHINLLEQRLLCVDDTKWFDNSGNLILQDNPVTSSFRPSNLQSGSYLVCYRPPNSAEECSEIVVVDDKILDLYLSKLKFSHHPLFSIEHVLTERLSLSFQQYKNGRDTVSELRNQLEALRVEKNKIGGGGDNKNTGKSDRETSKVRQRYFEESERERKNLKRVLETWKLVKKIREKQNYSNTSLKLLIKKEPVDVDAENEWYQRMFENTLEEILTERDIEDFDKIADSASENNDPRQKDEPDKDAIRKELEKRFQSCFKSPGEPVLNLTLSENEEISQETTISKEVTRRNVVHTTKFYLRVFCNNIEACKTKFLSLNEDFSVDIDETFCLQLSEVPKCLQLEIYEQPKSLLKKKIAEISIHIPSAKSKRKLYKKSFEKNEIVHYKHEGVGSGSNLKTAIEKFGIKISDNMDFELRTAGYLEYSLEWEKTAKMEENTELTTKLKFLNEIVNKNFVVSESKLKEFLDSGDWKISTTNFDIMPNTNSKNFRLNPHLNSLTFCDIQEIEENVRLKILQLRDQKEIEFDGIPVPNRIKEIPFNVLADYKRRKLTEERGLHFKDFDEEDVETQRKNGKKFLKQIYIRTFQLCKNTDNNLDYDSVIDERYIIYFHLMVKTLLRNLLNWFRWRPKISKPLPVLEKKTGDEIYEENSKLTNKFIVYLKIISARNVPSRLATTFNESAESVENEVRPFVRVGYKNLSARTSTSKGSNPVWNDILTIPLESTNTDYLNPNSLHGNISVNLFDESNIEIKKLSKKCVNMLGGLNISISTICSLNTMNGFFKIKLPHILLGYKTEEEKYKSNTTLKSSYSSSYCSYLEMEIYVEPKMPKMSPNMEELPSGDVPYIHDHILRWNTKFNQSYPDRKFHALTLDANGKTTCVTRFIRPLEPPQINMEEFDVTMEQCLRYVSLIPYTDCNQFYNCVWLSTDQLINLMIGSITDHVIALTCYLLALKVDVWLLLGYGIPQGNTSYVLVKKHTTNVGSPEYYILDVVYGEQYNLTDEYCPLQKIFCIINSSNVWGNIQSTDNLSSTRFDLAKKSDWLPLFDNEFTAPSNAVPRKLIYKSKQETDLLEMQLERHLKRQISNLRQLDRTTWNSGISSVLTNMLKALEMTCMFQKTHFETLKELDSDISPYTVSGFLFNIPFTSISSIIKKIKPLEIHIQQEKDIEFAVAVYIHSYPGLMLSVWICIASVKNND